MTGYVRKFEGNITMSFKISNKQLLKKYNQIWKKVKILLNMKLDSGPIYGDNDNYIKTKIKTYAGSMITNFHSKRNVKRKRTMQVFINNNTRICYQSKEKELSSNTFGRMQIWSKIKIENLTDDDLEKSSSDESSSESDNDSNDETESDDEKDNDESSE